jgi:glutathione synthase/RimK-type ligase-like ATP-grasp enzyme/gamma-glutamyl:cysteine ligase YbdK (ATP-grasp superfamily)
VSGRVVVVVSRRGDLPELPRERLVTADRYLGGGEGTERDATVVNLCRSHRYRSKGYYVSLIADARGQQAIPSAEAIQGIAESFGVFRVLQEAGIPTVKEGETRPRRRPAENGEEPAVAEALAYFGRCDDARMRAAAEAVYREWPVPVLRLGMVEEEGEWRVAQVAAVPVQQLGAEERAPLVAALREETVVLRRGAPRELKRASIAVLFDPSDPFSPSSPETIDRLERVAARRNLYLHRIGLDEIEKLGEYDALFIRTLTGVREPAFQFALRAEALDMPVIDDPQSIIRCSNKVVLEELLRREGIPTPRTLVVTPRTAWEEVETLGCPAVVKLPDGSFSAAVHKCADRAEYERVTAEMFRRSPLLIAQEFLPTEYDWRITVLEGKVLFAARYHMARGHWQIRSEDPSGRERYGKVEAVAREAAPAAVAALALRAAALIGSGLYGVDIKEAPGGPVVIEINDNPNLDVGYDDVADGARIYEDLLDYFVRRIEEMPSATAEEAAPAPALPPRHPAALRHYRPFEVAGMELEYAVVDRDLNAVPLVEPAFRAMAGRACSDIELGSVGFSNEIADHVFEVKTLEPVASLKEAEQALAEGVQRFGALLRESFGARLLPTGMHPWLNPRRARLWTRSNARIYRAYERLFDVHTHGWLNVHASHLNLPMGRSEEAVAMANAAALLIPYLPALAASSPMYDGELQPAVDNRLSWILRHQARIPESQGEIVPEYVESLADYRRRILGGMYRALDRLPDAGVLRHEFFNARGAVFKFSRKAMEIRVLDVQECPKMDVAIAAFVRSALRHWSRRLEAGTVELPEHAVLVEDFRATIELGTRARVSAPHLPELERGEDGKACVRAVLEHFLADARRAVRRDEADYLELVEEIVRHGSLSERIRAALLPHADADDETFTEAARVVYIELADALEANEPWRGRLLNG